MVISLRPSEVWRAIGSYVKTEKQIWPFSPMSSMRSVRALSCPTKHQLPLPGIPSLNEKAALTVSSLWYRPPRLELYPDTWTMGPKSS